MKINRLSIAIPTYNRVEYLKKIIEQFEEQISRLGVNIDIYVSDNSDNELTSLMIHDLEKKYNNIYYHKNEKNVGFDRNVINVVDKANSEYVWIFGDDDEIEENTLDKVLHYIKTYSEVDFFLVNSSVCSSHNMEKIESNLTRLDNDIYFKSPKRALEDISWYSTFIGAFIVKKDTWDKCNANKYLDTLFIHVGKLFESIDNYNSKVYFISEPLIKYRTNNTSWGNNFLNVQLKLWPDTINKLPNSYSKSTKLKAIKSVSNRFVDIGTLINLRLNNNLNIKSMKTYVFPFLLESLELYRLKIFTFSMILLFLPIKVLTILKKIKNFIKKDNYEKINTLKLIYSKLKTQYFYKLFMKSVGSDTIIRKPIMMSNIKNISIGNNVLIREDSRIELIKMNNNNPKLVFGNGISIEQRFHITVANNVSINDNVMISFDVSIQDTDHNYEDVDTPPKNQSLIVKETQIGENCFIGSGSKIQAGTILGRHCVVGTNSVVRGHFPDYCVIVGVPAKIVKRYDKKSARWRKTNNKGEFLDEI